MSSLAILWPQCKALMAVQHWSPEIIHWKEEQIKDLHAFLKTEYGNDEFYMERAQAFLKARFGKYEMERKGETTVRTANLENMLKALNDLDHQNPVNLCHKSRRKKPMAPKLQILFEEFEAYLEAQDISEESIKGCLFQTGNFFVFLGAKNLEDIRDFSFELFESYLKSKPDWKPKTIAAFVSSVRSLLRYLKEFRGISFPFYSDIRSKQPPKRAGIPAVWNEKEVKRFFQAIDRNSPVGKRDYAMFLTSYFLGLRPSDVVRLRLVHIDWEKKTLNFLQHKTQKVNSLPIPDLLGDALMDYLTHGRPEYYESDWLFLSHSDPYGPISSHYYAQRFDIYRAKAGLEKPGERGGLYSLRHTAGTHLLQKGTPLTTVSGILGHTSVNTTSQYLKLDLEMLRECVLDLDELLKEEAK